MLKLTLHKYNNEPDTSKSLIRLKNKDEFYAVMSSIPRYPVAISDGVYSITSQIAVDPYFDALLPLNAFKKFKHGFTIYGPGGFECTVENVADLVIKPADSTAVKGKVKPLYDNLKALGGRSTDAFVSKLPQKSSSADTLKKK